MEILIGPIFNDIKNVRNSTDILIGAQGDYHVGLGRWFGSDLYGELIQAIDLGGDSEPRHVVLCDWAGVPVVTSQGRLVLELKRHRKDNKPKKSLLESNSYEKNEFNILRSASQFRRSGSYLALDDPQEDALTNGSIAFKSGNFVFPTYYRCADRSDRATIAIRPNEDLQLIDVVGSRYTILQNETISSDLWHLITHLKQSEEIVHTRKLSRSSHVRGGSNVRFFGIEIALDDEYAPKLLFGMNINARLAFYHSHDRALTYTVRWSLHDKLAATEALLVTGTVKIRHTKRIDDRANLARELLSELLGAIKPIIETKSLLESMKIDPATHSLDTIIKTHVKAFTSREWLIRKTLDVYKSTEYAPTTGENCWTLFRAICAVDGAYWDNRTHTNGLPALISLNDAYRSRSEALKSLSSLNAT